jgi:hypothetical protein
MILHPWRKDDVLESLRRLDPTANESTRTHKVIAVLLGHIIKQDSSYDYNCQNLEQGLITDFEIFKEKSLIHIIEAKVSLGNEKATDQLKKYLIHRDCGRGCISDGYFWQFYTIKDQSLDRWGETLYTKYNLDEIVEKITVCP